MKLKRIQVEDLRFTNGLENDRTNTYLSLNDYDWMDYTLSTKFTTDKYGELEVLFNYFGATYSMMKVVRTKNKKTEKYEFLYSTETFIKYITIFLTNHIATWNEKYAFNGEKYVLDFYNEVIEIGEIK